LLRPLRFLNYPRDKKNPATFRVRGLFSFSSLRQTPAPAAAKQHGKEQGLACFVHLSQGSGSSLGIIRQWRRIVNPASCRNRFPGPQFTASAHVSGRDGAADAIWPEIKATFVATIGAFTLSFGTGHATGRRCIGSR